MPDKRDEQKSFIEKYGAVVIPVILTALFSLVGVYISNTYQATSTATQLISEREKAESELRASMFKDLITPIVGDLRNLPVERERLLVELLALNFGEHFELKPLMRHVDRSLALAEKTAGNENDRKRLQQERESLRSVSRRVSTRQIAMLLNQGEDGDRTVILPLAFVEWGADGERDLRSFQEQIRKNYQKTKQVGTVGQGESIRLCSPDRKYTALVGLGNCDWLNQTCVMNVNLIEKKCLPNQANSSEEPASSAATPNSHPAADMQFEIGWFDFPLTDNSLLSDGNRFAVVIQGFEPEYRTVALDFVWFPKAYFAPRERPINYADIRKKLHIEPNR